MAQGGRPRGNTRGRIPGRTSRSRSTNAYSELANLGEDGTPITSSSARDDNYTTKCNGTCGQIFSENNADMIQCERCERWTCLACSQISELEFDLVSKKKKFHWFCDSCEISAMTAVVTDASIEEKIKTYCQGIEDRLKTVEEAIPLKADKITVDTLAVKVNSIEGKLKDYAGDISKVNSNINMIRTEASEKEKRIKNIVIRGLQENLPANDTETVNTLLSDIGCPGVQITNITRLGPPPKTTTQSQSENPQQAEVNTTQTNTGQNNNTQPQNNQPPNTHATTRPSRPIRIILENLEDKKKILKNATKVRQVETDKYNPKAIFLIPDQTKLEREEDLQLRRKLREKRNNFPNMKFFIKGGKIIQKTN